MNENQQKSPLKAIRDFCKYDCCLVSADNAGAMEAWKECEITTCPLNSFRLGKNPFRKRREMTDEQRQKIAERLKKARDNNTED